MGARDTANYVVTQNNYGTGVGVSPKDLVELAETLLTLDTIVERIQMYANKLIDGDSVKYTITRLINGETL